MDDLTPYFDDPKVLDLLHSGRFSGVVSIVHEGLEKLTFASGVSNRQTGQLINRHTCFPTASVSKMFTAICVARLVEAGLCRFDQPLGELVPSLAPHFDVEATLSALLTHRSGLGDYIDDEGDLPFAGIDLSRLNQLEDFLPLVLPVPRHNSGEFRYSSAGYILIGLAIEKLTGLPFSEAMTRWVTKPAGLVSTGFPRLDADSDDLAVGYLDDGFPNLRHLPPLGGPDGGIVTNITDLLTLFDRLRDGTFISPEMLDYLLQPISPINERLSYGHGFYISKIQGQTWYGHTGSDPGLSARVAFSRQPHASIIVLCNQDNSAFPVYRAAETKLSC